MKLYTIGHSNHPIDKFIELLQRHSVATLVDVRTTPFSRFNPQFNRGNLQRSLPDKSIEYLYMGDTLGGRPADPTCYIHQTIPKANRDYQQAINYREVMQRPWFIQGIEDLLEVACLRTTCILCSEGDPTQCHRHHLISAYLMKQYPLFEIIHILRDGSLVEAPSIPVVGGDKDTEQLSF